MFKCLDAHMIKRSPKNLMNILLAGGGSGGPVSPLIAVAEEIKIKHPQARFLLVGTQNGPEGLMAKNAGIDFVSINAPKLRRYFSFQNFLIPFSFVKSFFDSKKIINSFKPDCVFGTGSFVQVPLVLAAKLNKIPVVLHQQDIFPSLANKLCQFFAKKITVTFKYNLTSFYSGLGFLYSKKAKDKIVLTGNPFRPELRHGTKESGIKVFGLKNDLPTLLVLGGGTGAKFLNKLIWDTLPSLAKTVQIVHATGKGKMDKTQEHENYHQLEFISNMADAYAASDMVLCRAGLSTITELSNLKKISIIIPIPKTHQEFNAYYLKKRHAAIVLDQNDINLNGFVNLFRKLIFAQEVQENIKQNISVIMEHDAARKISEIVISEAIKK
jgi:UDP-N-acetylglucosamine--N-acetylmuramyl-(pentapeptide) pyrophosphoryl-undecaprenol N-acetylglucosamine transferase